MISKGGRDMGMKTFFDSGGVFIFDENNAKSERLFYDLEDFMASNQGQYIVEIYTDHDQCLYYDERVIDESTALNKFNTGQAKAFF